MYILTNGVYAIGTFKTVIAAEDYRKRFCAARGFKVMEILLPSFGIE